MSNVILVVDGENFKHKVETVLKEEKINKDTVNYAHIDINALLESALPGYAFDRKIFYGAKLHPHKDFIKKSTSLIKEQRSLKTHLEKEGFEFIMSGNVRAQEIMVGKSKKVIFREKGVDVKMAVDLVAMACDKQLDTVVICSSDSDLQPAIAELKKRDVQVVYLGFETQPNRGLSYTSNKTILIRNGEILLVCPKV